MKQTYRPPSKGGFYLSYMDGGAGIDIRTLLDLYEKLRHPPLSGALQAGHIKTLGFSRPNSTLVQNPSIKEYMIPKFFPSSKRQDSNQCRDSSRFDEALHIARDQNSLKMVTTD